MDKEVKKVTVGLVLSWIFGVIFILSGLGALFSLQLISALVLLVMAIVLLPPANKFISNKFKFELSKGIKALIIIVGLVIVGFSSDFEETTPTTEPATTQEKPKEVAVVSNSFDDFSIKCDRDATNLQKQDLFKSKFKNNYVEWTGEVSSISESFGKYTLQVKHCPLTFTSDILVQMKDDQREKLLTFRDGDQITYRAKLVRLGDILGLSATDGIVIE